MLTIEEGDPIEPTVCKCCGGISTNVTRFVHKDGVPHAAYFAGVTDNHPEKLAHILLGLGEWGDDATSAQRRSFALEMRKGPRGFEVRVIDAASSHWPRAKVLGRTLDREEALADPEIQDVFHITDHMVIDDAVIREYFAKPDA